jgi:hypothetical protein
MDERETVIRDLILDPVLGHAVFFGDAHAQESPPFHKQVLKDWHSDHPRVLDIIFRGGAKSTLAEEAITIQAAALRTRNCIILGESVPRAIERLATIKHHFEHNEAIQSLFDVGPGDTWAETKATLSNGVILQAFGREQSLRGVKYLDQRPDLAFIDDLDDRESVATPESRRKTRKWLTSVVIPAMDPHGRIRMAATPLHPEALAPTLARAPGWLTRTVPIMYKGADGAWVATWPERFSVEWALAMWKELEDIGQGEDFMQEYMCQAVDPASQVFTDDMFRITPRVRSWHPVYAIYDPARTKNERSATTGKAVASWIGNRLVVWESAAKRMLPDEIIADIFDVDERYNPVAIGFEEDGLNEWALQPIRAKQMELGRVVPLRPLKAPKGKLDFISGLQPYFKAGEVEFVGEQPELKAQLIGFPTGHIDAPNALAYMLKMRMGVPIYDNFRDELVAEEATPNTRAPIWLALGSNGSCVTGQLLQMFQGQMTVFADWLYEGDAGTVLLDMVEEARLYVSGASRGSALGGKAGVGSLDQPGLRLIIPRFHFDAYATLGLVIAARKISRNVTRGGDTHAGREEVRGLMRKSVHGHPAVRVSKAARWTLRAFAGGFARDADKIEPQENAYAVMMQGIETFAAMLRGASSDGDSEPNYAYTPGGQRYVSALPR